MPRSLNSRVLEPARHWVLLDQLLGILARMSKRRTYSIRGHESNVDRRQIIFGSAVMVVVPLGGIAWGIAAAQQRTAPDQEMALAGLAVGVVLGALAAGAYALVERARRGSFFVEDPVEVERNRRRGRFSWSYAGIGVLLAAAVRFIPVRLEFLLGGALCGVMLAWAPILVAAAVRRLRRAH
jgi:ABC-type Fe3+-siderophore transport system permease subunit